MILALGLLASIWRLLGTMANFQTGSPLYVFSSTFTSAPNYNDLVQVLSVVIWSLTIVVTLKYVLIILHADNDGEGGTFSCYSLLTRYVSIPSHVFSLTKCRF